MSVTAAAVHKSPPGRVSPCRVKGGPRTFCGVRGSGGHHTRPDLSPPWSVPAAVARSGSPGWSTGHTSCRAASLQCRSSGSGGRRRRIDHPGQMMRQADASRGPLLHSSIDLPSSHSATHSNMRSPELGLQVLPERASAGAEPGGAGRGAVSVAKPDSVRCGSSALSDPRGVQKHRLETDQVVGHRPPLHQRPSKDETSKPRSLPMRRAGANSRRGGLHSPVTATVTGKAFRGRDVNAGGRQKWRRSSSRSCRL